MGTAVKQMVCVLVKPFHHSSTNRKIFSKRCANWVQMQEWLKGGCHLLTADLDIQIQHEKYSLFPPDWEFSSIGLKWLLLLFWNFKCFLFTLPITNYHLQSHIYSISLKNSWPQQKCSPACSHRPKHLSHWKIQQRTKHSAVKAHTSS